MTAYPEEGLDMVEFLKRLDFHIEITSEKEHLYRQIEKVSRGREKISASSTDTSGHTPVRPGRTRGKVWQCLFCKKEC